MNETPEIVPCYKCDADVPLGAHVCKNCKAHYPGRKVRKPFMMQFNRVLIYTFGALVLSVIPLIIFGTPSSPAGAGSAASKHHEFGFQCLDKLDGSHGAFKREVRAMMREPSSFKHIETRVMAADRFGNHKMTMTYSAKNGFGGTNVEIATGEFNRDTCKHRLSFAQ